MFVLSCFKLNTNILYHAQSNDYYLFHFRIPSSQNRDFTAETFPAGETQEGAQIFPDDDAVSSTPFLRLCSFHFNHISVFYQYNHNIIPFIQENERLVTDRGNSREDFRPNDTSNRGENKLYLDKLPSHQVEGTLVFF